MTVEEIQQRIEQYALLRGLVISEFEFDDVCDFNRTAFWL